MLTSRLYWGRILYPKTFKFLQNNQVFAPQPYHIFTYNCIIRLNPPPNSPDLTNKNLTFIDDVPLVWSIQITKIGVHGQQQQKIRVVSERSGHGSEIEETHI